MDVLEIIIQIIGGLLAVLGEAFLTNLFPNVVGESKFQRKERLNEETAAKHRIVKLCKGFTIAFSVLLVTINLVEIFIIFAKPIFNAYLTTDYFIALVIWSILTVFDDVMMFIAFTKAYYDDEKIVIKRPLLKSKIYYFDDITFCTMQGNLKVKTAKGSFGLPRVFAGTETLRGIIMSKICYKNSVDN